MSVNTLVGFENTTSNTIDMVALLLQVDKPWIQKNSSTLSAVPRRAEKSIHIESLGTSLDEVHASIISKAKFIG